MERDMKKVRYVIYETEFYKLVVGKIISPTDDASATRVSIIKHDSKSILDSGSMSVYDDPVSAAT